MNIRSETAGDSSQVRAVNVAAFARSNEAQLVDTLRRQDLPLISLVAEESGSILGHILFSKVSLGPGGPGRAELELMGLAPLAVAPSHQGRGIGSALVRAGLEACARAGAGAVVVLGEPQYYARFGFGAAAPLGIRSEYEVPEDAFMVVELVPTYLRAVRGTVVYHPVFADV